MSKPTEFQKLLAASFISQTGSHFLTLALSAFVLISTGSSIQSGLVFVLSFLPSILAGARLGNWVDRRISKWLIARNEIISISSTLLCGLCIHFHLPMMVLCSVLAARSMLMFIGRAAATKWLKVITPPNLQNGRLKLFYLVFFLSTAVSGIMASVALRNASIWNIVLIDCVSYCAGVLLYLSLARLPTLETPSPVVSGSVGLRETLSTVFAMPVLRTSFVMVCLTQALFQGAYSALVSFLPIRIYQMGVGGVGAFQIAASIGITAGFLVNWIAASALVESDPVLPKRSLTISIAAVLCLLLCVGASTAPVSLIGFLALNLAYECVWLHHSSEFFRGSPKSDAARYQFTLSSCAAFLMALSTLAYSAAIQFLGPVSGIVTVLMFGLVGSVLLPAVTRGVARPSFAREEA